MPLQKILKFNGGHYFQCLHSGALMEKCYAYPDFDGFRRRKNGGSFFDAACAVAWLEKNHETGKITDKKYTRLLMEIKREVCTEKGQELIAAPEMKPGMAFWDYRNDYPHMIAGDFLLTVEEVLEWKEEDKRRREERSKDDPKPYIYQTINGEIYQLDHEQFPMRQDSVIHICPGKGIGIILEDFDATGSSRDLIGDSLGTAPNKDCILILSKKFQIKKKRVNDDKDTPKNNNRKRKRPTSCCIETETEEE